MVSSVSAADIPSERSFISGMPTRDVDCKPHVHIDPAVLKILHEKERLPARFIVDLYEAEDWTIFPTSISTTISDMSVSIP